MRAVKGSLGRSLQESSHGIGRPRWNIPEWPGCLNGFRMLKKTDLVVLETREAYLVKRRSFPDSDVSRFTFYERRQRIVQHPVRWRGRGGAGPGCGGGAVPRNGGGSKSAARSLRQNGSAQERRRP